MANQTTPSRVQRRRTKGYRMPPNTTSVTRPSRWGNPYRIGGSADDAATELRKLWPERTEAEYKRLTLATPTREESIEAYAVYAGQRAKAEPEWLAPLRGQNLACYCPDGVPCHANVLLESANDEG